MRNDIRQKAFTVVELLVVIAILGLLSSVILVSLKGTRKKASIASGEQFSSSIYHRFGSDAAGIWNFDNNTLEDTSGNDRNFLCSDICTTSVSGIIRNAVDLDKDSYLYTEYSPAGYFTQEFWVNLDEVPSDTKGALSIIVSLIEFAYNEGKWDIKLGTEDNVSCEPLSLNKAFDFDIQEWTHFALTYDGATTELFVNGSLWGEDASCSGKIGPLINYSYWLYIGPGFDGRFDEVRFYEEALSNAQIRDHYVKGAKKRGLVIK